MSTKNLIQKSWKIFIGALVLTLLLEFFVHMHETFGIDGTLFFNAWYGFASCMAIIFVSKFLGKFVKRDETYYEEEK